MICPDVRSARADAYRNLLATAESITHPPSLSAIVDLAWDHLHPTGVSWLGFYRFRPTLRDLELVVCRDRPACSPIGLHGVCGQAHLSGRTRIVADVADLGAAYVACDPADRSEIVVPVAGRDPSGAASELVLDLDSRDLGAFSDDDDRELRRYLQAVGLFPIPSDEPWRGGGAP